MKLKTISRMIRWIGSTVGTLVLVHPALAAQPLTAAARLGFVHSFTEQPDGAQPEGGLTRGADGALYGMTTYGGTYGVDPIDFSNGNGTIFRIGTDNSYSVLYSFTLLNDGFSNVDGRWPNMPLIAAPDGSFYGVTPYGGTYDGGVVFHYSTTAGLTALHYFLSADDVSGSYPQAPPALGPGGVLFGTTEYGGSDFPNDGTAYSLNLDGSGFQVLQSFGGTSGLMLPNSQLLAASDGQLYGIATSVNGYAGGALYRIAADGTGFTMLHEFDYGSEGGFMTVGVIPPPIQGSDGLLYGATADGGSGDGAIYRMATDGSGFTVLHSFAGLGSGHKNTGGGAVHAPVVFGSDGQLYGVTQFGGTNGTGTAFRMASDGSGFTTLYNFPAVSRKGINKVGAEPTGSVAFSQSGQLCGTALVGGSAALGTAWCLKVK